MFHSRVIVAAALLAFGASAVSPAMAGGKNGGGGGGGGGSPSKNGGGGGGGGGSFTRIICVVNGRRFEAQDERSCYQKRTYTYGYRYVHVAHPVINRRYIVKKPKICGCALSQSGYVGGDAGAYGESSYSTSGRKYKKLRRFPGYDTGGYEAGYTYDPGYVIQYGPTISKDGAN